MNIINNYLPQIGTNDWLNKAENIIKQKFAHHGDVPKWEKAVNNLPIINNITYDLGNTVIINTSDLVDKSIIEQNLRILCPWRKGPFNLFGIDIDSEWRSDLKWHRIKSKLNLTGHSVLDVGCGNGYYLWRMFESGAKSVIGIDPNLLFYHQFLVFKRYLPDLNVWQIPLTLEDLPITPLGTGFDSVFSMGVLYHRKDPISHLERLRSLLAKNGQLIVETLIIDGDEKQVLIPKVRYAQMRNVWFIPSVDMLQTWLNKIGFKDVRCIDISTTTTTEQRVTSWMQFQSLKDFLNPNDPSLTIENLPAPKRAILIAS